ncbi:indolepyruvate oxidoreductase subunit beta family protein [Roseomonas sp. KE2513]|uniref:indolepyruvate oxidoreductase subunit beta family protein n=1 Tax=Roseomonas sp. KE2513 TaxID=2479202 RepID=UPI0018DF2D29|nr:indolepyruvate oxidoreductase subunit beta family protein [Roseomonas sp. KE2513]MBI0536707.1 indolepyruvate oxidoreductase subunit beta family protein [Roseomonas sp. KE2513]
MTRPLSILVSAMGGEGGGVLTDWIVGAAQRADLPVQGTSIPGVAQRTGATTYYIEMWPEPWPTLAGRRPVFGLGPSPGDVDVVIATELVEAGRCCERGFVSPDRTTLVASTRRVFATSEKSAMGDGRFDVARVMRAIREMPRRALLVDASAAEGQALNAVLLGRMAASGVVPIPLDALRAAIAAGVAPEANLRAFETGLALSGPQPAAAPASAPRASLPALLADAAASLPPEVLAVADIALPRLARYQSARYAATWMERVRRVLAADPAPGGNWRLSAEVARQLTLWMAYEDVVRIAQHKSSAARFAEIRAEVRARPGEPVTVTEHMKPGWEEVASLLPPAPGRALLRWAERTGRIEGGMSLRLRSTTLSGFLRLFLLARLRPWRPFTLRWAEEGAAIEEWLARVIQAAARGDHALAIEIAALPRLLKGYGETYRRGRRAFAAVMKGAVEPALAGPAGDPLAAGRVARAREAALADPEHAALRGALANA